MLSLVLLVSSVSNGNLFVNGELESADASNNPAGWTYTKDAAGPATGTLQTARTSPFTNVFALSTKSWQFNDWTSGNDYKPQLYQSFVAQTTGILNYNFDFYVLSAITSNNCILDMAGVSGGAVRFRIGTPVGTAGAVGGEFSVSDQVRATIVADEYYNVNTTLDLANQVMTGTLTKWDGGVQTAVLTWTNLSFSATGGVKNLTIFDAGSDTKIMNFDNFALNVVPEPATVLLLGIGSLCSVIRKRK